MQEFFQRHERIAFELSGGKDSTAALFLLRPYWDQMMVFWCNTGRPAPEVQEHVYRVAEMLPKFCEVMGKRDQVWAKDGWPSDLIPVHFVPFGQMVRGADPDEPGIQGRYDCCTRSLMNPLHEAVTSWGATGIVRGQKDADAMKGSLRSGTVHAGIEYLYPIERWTDAEVWAYIEEHDLPVPESYRSIDVSPDCIDCTAWWGEQRSRYLKERHPEEYQKYLTRLRYIKAAIQTHLNDMNKEVM